MFSHSTLPGGEMTILRHSKTGLVYLIGITGISVEYSLDTTFNHTSAQGRNLLAKKFKSGRIACIASH